MVPDVHVCSVRLKWSGERKKGKKEDGWKNQGSQSVGGTGYTSREIRVGSTPRRNGFPDGEYAPSRLYGPLVIYIFHVGRKESQ